MFTYRSLKSIKNSDSNFSVNHVKCSLKDLPAGDVLISVQYAALGYYDAMCLVNKEITFTDVNGTDASGIVVKSNCKEFNEGDEVIVTGNGLGQKIPGAFGQYISVPSSAVDLIPIGITLKQAAAIGSAGILAGMFISSLADMRDINNFKIVVTMGDFDSSAIVSALASSLGYDVLALVKNVKKAKEYLSYVGVSEVEEIYGFGSQTKKKDFLAGFDTIGGNVLPMLIDRLCVGGLAFSAGKMGNSFSNINLSDLIAKNISIKGCNPFFCEQKMRSSIWYNYTNYWKKFSDWFCFEITLDQVEQKIESIVSGDSIGRCIVNMQI